MIGAAFKLFNTFYPKLNVGHLIDAVITLAIGIWVLQAANAFRKVATLGVADQDYLVVGFSQLRKAFLLQSILVIVSLAILCGALLLLLLLGVSR